MGVKYKIKQEVIDYVLGCKTKDPRLSCRNIAESASQYFQKKISKSSVNSILKNFSLSSPVGRRQKKEKKPPVFKIPSERKEQIFKSIPKSFLNAQETTTSVVSKKHQKIVNNAGVLFFMAACLETSVKKLLSLVLNTTHANKEHEQNISISEALLLAPLLGITTIEDAAWKDVDDLWQACEWGEPMDPAKMVLFAENIDYSSEQSQIIHQGKQGSFTEVKFFKFFLKNGQEFYFDSRLNSIWTNNNVQKGKILPITKALDYLSKYFITHTSPVIIKNVVSKDLPSLLFPLFCAFDDRDPFKIIKIELWGEQGNHLSTFGHILKRKRTMIVGVKPQEEYLRFADKTQTHSLTNKFLYKNRSFMTQEFILNIPVSFSADFLRLRYCVFWKKGYQENKNALLSNVSLDQAPIEKILSFYLDRWLDDSQNTENKEDMQCPERGGEETNLTGLKKNFFGFFGVEGWAGPVFSDIFCSVHGLVKKCFFPKTLFNKSLDFFIEDFYSLRAEIVVKEKTLLVIFLVSSQYQKLDLLKEAIQALNESVILDEHTRQFVFDVRCSND